MRFLQDKRIRTLILIMSVLVAITILFLRNYYRNINQSVDPRIVSAREMYGRYNTIAESGDYEAVFILLDSIETIYSQIPHYRNSYELGVLYNNRAAALLTIAMIRDSISIPSRVFQNLPQDTLLEHAKQAVDKSIRFYTNWLTIYEDIHKADLDKQLRNDFFQGLLGYSSEEMEGFLENRKEEIIAAQYENIRRLSVSYTNLGIIYRNRKNYEQALIEYKKAIELWDENLVAKNNMNMLLGRPLEKQNIIRKLFPPEKKEKREKQ